MSGKTSDKGVRRLPSRLLLHSLFFSFSFWFAFSFFLAFTSRSFFRLSLTFSRHSSSHFIELPEDTRDTPDEDDRGRREGRTDMVEGPFSTETRFVGAFEV